MCDKGNDDKGKSRNATKYQKLCGKCHGCISSENIF